MTAAPDSAPPLLPAAGPTTGSVWHRVRGSMTRQEWVRAGGMAAFVVALHVIGWFTLVAIVAPHHYGVGEKSFGIGIGVTAYTLGMRHAFDADHIAAIDNTTRKLMGEGQRPLSVGFWFSLGHSSAVFGLCTLIGFGVRAVASQVADSSSPLQNITGIWGTLISGGFLLLIGLVNAVVLAQILRVFRRMRGGHFDEN